jgi:hypothetical protein
MINTEQIDKQIAEQIKDSDFPYEFSVCTLVSRMDQYHDMLQSFINAGFTLDKCEYVFINNTERNNYDAYQAYNIFLQRARAKYVIICHQDIELRYDKIDVLRERIYELNRIDPKWALIGNAGAINLVYKTAHISHGDPPEHAMKGNCFPQKVMTLDENFILIKKQANLAVSSDLAGFHFYGTDVCMIASILGYNAYVADFHLYHKSTGNMDEEFFSIKKMLHKKYQRALRGRYILTVTRQKLYLSGSRLANLFFNTGLVRRMAKTYFKFRFLLYGTY